MERRKWVKGYENLYMISDHGRVVAIYKKIPHLIGTSKDLSYYRACALKKNNETKNFQVHRLVIETFVGKIAKGLYVNHIDGVRYNNHVGNLECVTPKENSMHSVKLRALQKKQAQNPFINLNNNEELCNCHESRYGTKHMNN